MSGLWRKIRALFVLRGGKSIKEAAAERAADAAIPGYSWLHGPFIWFLPETVIGIRHGVPGHVFGLLGVWILWWHVLPAFDSWMLRRSYTRQVDTTANAQETIYRKVSIPTGTIVAASGILAVIVIFALRGWTFQAIGDAIIAMLAINLLAYVVGEVLWAKHVAVATRLRVFERRYDLVEVVFDRSGDITDLSSYARSRMGERFERGYGWRGRKAAGLLEDA